MARRLLEQHTGTLDVDPPGPEPAEIDELTEAVRARLNQLPERERRLIRQRYMQGRTLTSVGEEEGVSCERVRQIIQRGLARLRTPDLEELL
jgi:RNA polymerase sigma factor (sigma-70 family)